MKQELRQKLVPLWMTLAVIVVDQVSKLIVTLTMTESKFEDYGINIIGDFFRLNYRTNPYIIFSLGGNLPPILQTLLFLVLPVAAIALVIFFYFREKDLKQVYRLPLAAIIGGGIGNLLDRILRQDGVVDFLDFKFYGIFGLSRWPTFNLADSSIVIGVGAILVIGIIHEIRKLRKKRETPGQ